MARRSRSASSARWLREHQRDRFVQQAKVEGYRSRAAFKLESLLAQTPLLRTGMRVLDVGASPGGWSQVILRRLNGNGFLAAVDILPCDPLSGMHFVCGDVREETVQLALLEALQGAAGQTETAHYDLIVSDMAPNFSGNRMLDYLRSAALCEILVGIFPRLLARGGHAVFKAFPSEDTNQLLKTLRTVFEQVRIRKPEASRARSGEIYVICQAFSG